MSAAPADKPASLPNGQADHHHKEGKRKRNPDLQPSGDTTPPALKRGRQITGSMKRTPQGNLTQSRLTGSGMLKIQQNGDRRPPPDRDESCSENDSFVSSETITSPPDRMETGSPVSHPPTGHPPTGHPPTVPGVLCSPAGNGGGISKDFLLHTLKLNTEEIIRSFTAHLGALNVRVEQNSASISANSEKIDEHGKSLAGHGSAIEELSNRVRALERNERPRPTVPRRAVLSKGFEKARRSVRLWPIPGGTVEELWEGVGDFLHGQLAIPVDDVCQDDVESVERVVEVLPGNVRDEVLVTFHDKKKRDKVMVSSTNLAGCVDEERKPTAGTRLEVPPELQDTFRLLSRFGTRLRARHGEGTRRHIKFDDFHGSLFANVKLPGDTSWTKVTPDMAREDLEASLREEDSANQRRLAAKLIPGPRERLSRPMILAPMSSGSTVPLSVGALRKDPVAAGRDPAKTQRTRWSGPPKGDGRK